ncbi:DUF418 domain-containing protein [Metabacillus elymi]|uniref:DUF418 domain-containing protein n=1 Tax=Metabacillus elymi TaxID=2745198 RepID=A0ABX6SAC1_9BACI|nr:DUF418 domain-containing protein [Metabacillus sp. KUDC1714]QNF30508.1 DUF418 domain-containing protein [Metabacillus sp. KUDC1714]
MTDKSSRILLLDIIRGVALLGILLVNMRTFHSPDFLKNYYGITTTYHGADHFLSLFYQLFIQMKFYPIFAFLFGLGFYLFIMKTNGLSLFIKRMIFLLMIGLIHLIFLWYGDILHLYAVTGLLLLFFHKLSSKKILYWSFAFLTLYHVLLGASVFLPTDSGFDQHLIMKKIDTYSIIYEDATYKEWLFYRIKIEVIPILTQLPIAMVPILGMFLLGLYAGKQKLFVYNDSNRLQIKTLCKWSFLMSLPIIFANGLILSDLNISPVWEALTHFLTSLSGITLCIFYMSSLYLLIEHTTFKKRFIPFSYVGRMALTNYLLQTIVSLCFFRVFHLYEKINLVEGTFFSFLLFSSQVLFSYFWLTYFQIGPVEWLWRSFTYGKFVPFKKVKQRS